MRLLTAIALCLCVFAFGCPKEKRALNGARKAVEVAAETVLTVDKAVAVLYSEASAEALAACETRECYDAQLYHWNKTVVAVAMMKLNLLVVEASLDAWEAGSPNGRDNLRDAAACFLESLVRLEASLNVVGADVPALNNGISLGRDLFGLGGVACPAGASA
jgi:hypothetical protein